MEDGSEVLISLVQRRGWIRGDDKYNSSSWNILPFSFGRIRLGYPII